MTLKTLLLAVLSLVMVQAALAEDVRYYNENGVTYREVRRRVQRPITETKVEQRSQTVYREQYVTESRPSVRTVYTPITEYQMEARWHGVLNPFAPPYVGYHYVPRTRWEQRVESIPHTVTRRQLIPETRTVQVPVRSHRMVQDEVITRTAVSTSGQRTVASLPGKAVGGVSKMANDPPRKAAVWQPSGSVLR